MDYRIEEICKKYDEDICRIIKEVGAEYGAVGEGFGPGDAEVMDMSRHYREERGALYLIAIVEGRVVGGCGVASFNGSSSVCELKKLFLLPEGRGMGIGRELAERCLEFAGAKGYRSCYLDTLSGMKRAIDLYERMGFKHLSEPLEGGIHGGCDIWMIKELG